MLLSGRASVRTDRSACASVLFQDASGAGLFSSPLSPPRKTSPLDNCRPFNFLLLDRAVQPASACRPIAEPAKNC